MLVLSGAGSLLLWHRMIEDRRNNQNVPCGLRYGCYGATPAKMDHLGPCIFNSCLPRGQHGPPRALRFQLLADAVAPLLSMAAAVVLLLSMAAAMSLQPQ